MVALLDVLTSSCCVTLLALQVQQTGAWISVDLSLNTLAAQTTHILLNVFLVEAVDHGAFVATLQKHVAFGAKVSLDIHL